MKQFSTFILLFLAIFVTFGLGAVGAPPAPPPAEPQESRFQREFLWGTEFTFSSDEISRLYNETRLNQWREIEAKDRARKRLLYEMLKMCPTCKQLARLLSERIVFSDDYWIDLSLDLGVIETQAKPATLKQYIELASHFNLLFTAAEHVGLTPDTFISGGHIHIGLAEFGEDPLLLRNFIVDFTNHFELAEGILDLNERNARSLRSLYDEDKALSRLRVAIAQLDLGTLRSPLINSTSDQGRILKTSQDFVDYYYTVIQHKKRSFALNLQNKYGTIEIRSIRAQLNYDEFIKEIKLFDARLKYLEKLSAQGVRLPLEPYVDHRQLGTRKFDRLLVQKFHTYVTEAGLSWQEYKPLIYLTDLKRKKIDLGGSPEIKGESCRLIIEQ